MFLLRRLCARGGCEGQSCCADETPEALHHEPPDQDERMNSLSFSHSKALPAAIHRPAAVHCQRMAVDESALLRVSEKEDGACNVVWRGKSSHWVNALNIRVVICAATLIGRVHLRLHPARTHGVAANTAPAPFGRQGAR